MSNLCDMLPNVPAAVTIRLKLATFQPSNDCCLRQLFTFSAVSKHLKYRSCAYDDTAYDFGMAEKVFFKRVY